MKKLVVSKSQLSESKTIELNLFLTMQYTYGVVDFDVDKVVDAACRAFGLELVSKEFPVINLVSANSAEVELTFHQEEYG